jgi:uncharacterized membrane protein
MPDLASLLPLILATHISLALALFVPGLLLPFTLRSRPARRPGEPGRVVRALTWIQAHGSVVIGAGLALTGVAMVVAMGSSVVQQPWLLVSLGVYALTAVIVLVIQRPALRHLRATSPASDPARAAWRDRARQQRYIAYGVTGAVGLIAFLMSTKPELW